MREGKTTSGFEYTFDDNRLNDMELLDSLADVVDGVDGLALSRAVRKIIPDAEERKRLYDHVRTEDGRVPADILASEIMEIIEGSAEGKK